MSHPQRIAARAIRAHYTKTQRRALGALWLAFIAPALPDRRKPPSFTQRRAAIGRCARLRRPTPQEIAQALLPD